MDPYDLDDNNPLPPGAEFCCHCVSSDFHWIRNLLTAENPSMVYLKGPPHGNPLAILKIIGIYRLPKP